MKAHSDAKAREFVKELPNFKIEYQTWYSESLALLKTVLPDRVQDFRSYYEYPRVRKHIDFQNYMIRDYLQGLTLTRMSEVLVDGSAAIPEFRQQLNIIKAAKATLESALMDLSSILQEDLFDSEIDSASALSKAGFLRAGGAICGVVLEKHLESICSTRDIAIRKKNPTIADYNQALKDNKIISVPKWRFIQHLADIRNICDHDKGN